MGIDDPISLSELLEVHDLRDVVQSFAGMHDVPVSVIERQESGPVLLATTAMLDEDVSAALGSDIGPVPAVEPGGGSMLYVAPVMHQGDMIAKVVVGPYRIPAPAPPPARAGGPSDGVPEAVAQRDTTTRRNMAGRMVILDDTEAGNVARHIASILEVLVHNAHARFMISALHNEAMKANFAELSAKNERLERAVERMQEVDRLKSSFLATMSHELRTPLTSVIGYSEMLIEGLAGELKNEQREYMKTILSKAEHLLQLITGILDVSMLESGSMELRRDAVSMTELVESVIATVRPTLRTRRIKYDTPERRLPRVLGDRQKIREVLRNLLTNAIKFTPEGGQIAVALALGPLRPEDLHGAEPAHPVGLQVIISDSGIGMSPDEQARIFEPFFQVDSSSTRRYGGSGLGLTLVKRYVEALGGNIWVDSTPGSGSSFTVALPTVPGEPSGELSAEAREDFVDSAPGEAGGHAAITSDARRREP